MNSWSEDYHLAGDKEPPLILVVDDHLSVRIQLHRWITEAGYRVEEARNGEECLAVYNQVQPDIVLLDAVMPVMDGFACCAHLQALPAASVTPVLMITGLEDQESVDRAFSVGATDFITKPIHWPILLQRLRRLIQQAELYRQLGMANQNLEQRVQERTAALLSANQQLQKEIEKHKQAQAALQLTKERLQAVLDAVPGLVSWISADLHYLGVNHYLANALNRDPEEMVGQPVGFIESAAPAAPSEFNQFVQDFFASGTTTATRELVVMIDGVPQNYLIVAQSYQSGQAAIFIGLDITAQKQAEAGIRQALAREQELGELKSRFISMVSHELRTPMTTILSSAEMLAEAGHVWSEERRVKHFDRIRAAVNRMTNLLGNVLAMGKYSAGVLEFHPAPLDLTKFCVDLVEEIQQMNGQEHVIIFSCADGCPPIVHMDHNLLRYIFSNLLLNSVKYSPREKTIWLKLTCTQDQAVFRVVDQGIGIPSDDVQHLFTTFHRGRNVGNIPGTGLGLPIVKSCVDLHRGTIHLKSKVGVGTAFTITLPLNTFV